MIESEGTFECLSGIVRVWGTIHSTLHWHSIGLHRALYALCHISLGTSCGSLYVHILVHWMRFTRATTTVRLFWNYFVMVSSSSTSLSVNACNTNAISRCLDNLLITLRYFPTLVEEKSRLVRVQKNQLFAIWYVSHGNTMTLDDFLEANKTFYELNLPI